MADIIDELVRTAVGAFLRENRGKFFCAGCIAKHAELNLVSSVSKAQARRVTDAMFENAQARQGLFQYMPAWFCAGCAVTNPCIGDPAIRAYEPEPAKGLR